jgi:hypothetical protein
MAQHRALEDEVLEAHRAYVAVHLADRNKFLDAWCAGDHSFKTIEEHEQRQREIHSRWLDWLEDVGWTVPELTALLRRRGPTPPRPC